MSGLWHGIPSPLLCPGICRTRFDFHVIRLRNSADISNLSIVRAGSMYVNSGRKVEGLVFQALSRATKSEMRFKREN